MDQTAPLKDIMLAKETFEFNNKCQSMDFDEVSGCKDKPTWYSPSAANWGQRDSDLILIQGCPGGLLGQAQ